MKAGTIFIVTAGATREALYELAERLIIDGADACTNAGPCPRCTETRGSVKR